MPAPRLLIREGKPVPEWTLPPRADQEGRAGVRALPEGTAAATASTPPKARAVDLPGTVARQLLLEAVAVLLPLHLPASLPLLAAAGYPLGCSVAHFTPFDGCG